MGPKLPKIKENYFYYLSKKDPKRTSKLFYQSTIKDNYRQLFYLLAGGGVDFVTAEDEDLIIFDNLIGHL